MSEYWSIGTVSPSTGASVYATGVVPGGCTHNTGEAPSGNFDSLSDAPQPPNQCTLYSFDNVFPMADGSGSAFVCSKPDNILASSEPCSGEVFWSPETFIYEVGYDARVFVPQSCQLQVKKYSWSPSLYICSGGSIVRSVKDDGTCSWQGSQLFCGGCVPRYAQATCDSILGEHPDIPPKHSTVDGTGSVAGYSRDGVSGVQAPTVSARAALALALIMATTAVWVH